jgi:hypothetical protein
VSSRQSEPPASGREFLGVSIITGAHLASSPGSLAIFAAIRRALSRETDHARASGHSRTNIEAHIAFAATQKISKF